MRIEELAKFLKIDKDITKHFNEYQQYHKKACNEEGLNNPSAESLQLAVNNLCASTQSLGSYVYTIEHDGKIDCKKEIELLQDLLILFCVIQTGMGIRNLNPKVHAHNAEMYQLASALNKQKSKIPEDEQIEIIGQIL